MEEFAYDVRVFFRKILFFITPHFRQVLRFFGLPYCYFALVDWKSCTASRLGVVLDFLYVFFVLRYFPDNYSNCHFYALPKSEWGYFYGSGYNPYQKGKLSKTVQPREYQILFEDKEVCHQLCLGAGISVPQSFGVLTPANSLAPQLDTAIARSNHSRLIAKPVTGASGIGIFLILKNGGQCKIEISGKTYEPNEFTINERVIVQELVQQHSLLEDFYSKSVNSVRVLTLWTRGSKPIVLSALVRFGVGTSFIDNWSAGGVAIGVNLETGKLMSNAYDKIGKSYIRHPDTDLLFEGFEIPKWDEVIEFSKGVQEAFSYHPMLGLDVAITNDGPILLEINAFPDLILQEQITGPLLKSRAVHREFENYDLLINKIQNALFK